MCSHGQKQWKAFKNHEQFLLIQCQMRRRSKSNQIPFISKILKLIQLSLWILKAPNNNDVYNAHLYELAVVAVQMNKWIDKPVTLKHDHNPYCLMLKTGNRGF